MWFLTLTKVITSNFKRGKFLTLLFFVYCFFLFFFFVLGFFLGGESACSDKSQKLLDVWQWNFYMLVVLNPNICCRGNKSWRHYDVISYRVIEIRYRILKKSKKNKLFLAVLLAKSSCYISKLVSLCEDVLIWHVCLKKMLRRNSVLVGVNVFSWFFPRIKRTYS